MNIRNIFENISRLSRKGSMLKKACRLVGDVRIKLYSHYDDIIFAQKMYHDYCNEFLNIEDPKSFNEKLWWLKYHYRNPLQKICSDKYKVREYVKMCGLANILVKLYGVYDRVDEIDFDIFKTETFIKLNVGSGCNYIFDPENRDRFDFSMFRWDMKSMWKHDPYQNSREWNFKDIEKKIVCEEVLRDKEGNLPKDWKFMCFSGEPKLLFYSAGVCDESGKHSVTGIRYTNVYDMKFRYVPIVSSFPTRPEIVVEKPKNFDLMKEYASILSKPFPHCRIDFYNVDGRIYLGEITFYHSGGCGNIEPKDWALKMGEWIDLESIPKEYLI